MIARLKSLSLDQIMLGLIALLVLAVGLVLVSVKLIGIRVRTDLTETNRSTFETITLTFSSPVDPVQVESSFLLEPSIEGRFEWVSSRVMRFIPAGFEPETDYELVLSAGEMGANGELLRRDKTWSFRTRKPLVAYIHSVKGKRELWVVGADGKGARRLLEIESAIADFDASPDGEFLVVSIVNKLERLDLWLADRDGQNLEMLLDCEGGNCSTPAISPDGKFLAYSRQAQGITPFSTLSSPRIYVFDLVNEKDAPLLADSQLTGYAPIWSPDGKWIASFDDILEIIRVVSIDTGKQVSLSSPVGTVLGWSPDSQQIAYITVDETSAGAKTVVLVANLNDGEVSYLAGKQDAQDYNYSALAWSPVDEEKLVVGYRREPDDVPNRLWLVSPAHFEGKPFAEEENHSYNGPVWDPWGKGILFQQIELSGGDKPESILWGSAIALWDPEIVFWEPEMSSPRAIADGFSPRWLP